MSDTNYAHYKVLYEIAREINSNLSVNPVLKAIVKTTTEAVGAKGCALILLKPDGKTLEHAVDYGLSDWYIKKGPIAVESVFEVLQGKPVAIINALEDPRVQHKEEARREGIASILSVPLMLRRRTIGVLRIYTAQIRKFSNDDIEFLVALANLGAVALEKARIFEDLDVDLKKALGEQTKLEEERQRFLRFLSIVAHDLKAPLAAIPSYFGVRLGGFSGPLNEKQKNMLERSSQRILELLALISDLLDVTRIETGQIVQEMKIVSFTDVIKKALEVVEDSAQKKGVTINSKIPSILPVIYASDVRLVQAITNLLTNAIKFTPKEGKINIAVKDEKEKLSVEVSDTGIGIPSEEMPRVFQEFFQGSNSQEKGTGLGLSIVKRVVEAHGGEIWVESPRKDIGLGTKFTFALEKSGSKSAEVKTTLEVKR